MCENGFDLNVRMASHGKFLVANRDVGLKLSQSNLILWVRCIEVDVYQRSKTWALVNIWVR